MKPIIRIAKATYDRVGAPEKTYSVFENRAGLGKTCEVVYQALFYGCSTEADIIEHTGCAKLTVRDHIDTLSFYSVITEVAGIIRPTANYDFEKLAITMGTRGRAEARRSKHDEERKEQAEYLEDRRLKKEREEQELRDEIS